MSKLFTLAAGVVIGVAYSDEIKEAIKELAIRKKNKELGKLLMQFENNLQVLLNRNLIRVRIFTNDAKTIPQA